MQIDHYQRQEVVNAPEESLEENFFRNAELLYANSDFTLARAIYARLHNMNFDRPEYLQRLAECFEKSNELVNARTSFEKLAEFHPSFENYVRTANFFYEQKDMSKAKAYYTKALCEQAEDFVSSFQMFKNLGNISLTEGDFEQAEEYYHRAQRIHSESDLLCVNYGSLYFQMGRYTEAIKSFYEALQINPKSSKARMGLALLYKAQDETEMAWANLKAAIDYDEANASYLKMLAHWSMSDFRYDDALEKLEKYLNQREYNQELNLLFACVLFQAGYREYAFWEAQKILNFDPDCEDARKLVDLVEAQNG
ncbi:MAG: tetratricopeptide repeat protein [Bdellovibrionota bacterium]|nr:tetratricopeptide repeat protein [Bdellovibrionota bacterium]